MITATGIHMNCNNERLARVALILLVMALGLPVRAEVVARTVPDTTPQGSGPYPVIPSTDPALPGRTLYAPPGGRIPGTHKLPVVAFANGGCIDNGTRFRWFLSEIASQGYFVVANGRMGSPEEQLWSPPQKLDPRNPPPMPDPASIPPPATTAAQLTEAINWIIAENSRAGSRYFGRIDTGRIAVMGMSCGGIQALQIATTDPRIVTTVMWDSGLFSDSSRHVAAGGPPITKTDLAKLRGSIAYFTGDQTDIAFGNAGDDFGRIHDIPALWAYRKGTPHDGTFGETNGGDFGRVGAAWLDWRLKGSTAAATLFTGADCGLCRDASWVVQRNALIPALGYRNTPLIPGTRWHVHDGDRPQPRIVTPAPTFSQMAGAPSDATVLFDGSGLSKWVGRDGPAAWKVQGGYMEVVPRSGSIRTRDRFADFQLHLEFATPAEVRGAGQGRGNSGILFNGVYEVQLLDSYGNQTYPDGQAGALYGQRPPRVNASRAPGEWQTMDIVFESPRWDTNGKLVKKANVTVMHNGVLLHHRLDLEGTTPHQANGNYDKPHEPEVFIELQDHGDLLHFRNIWVRPTGSYDSP